MRLVIIESPLAAPTQAQWEDHVRYAQEATLDSIKRGESPVAFHLLYPQVLDDGDPDQRALGMACARAWYKAADAVVVYTDLGVSPGMKWGEQQALTWDKPVEWRSIR